MNLKSWSDWSKGHYRLLEHGIKEPKNKNIKYFVPKNIQLYQDYIQEETINETSKRA